ncbi:non-ribosomal peptide synthetase [Nocardia yamanashiensis]|uniref:non-ribosomal peptide synthetase n=1 Tax=Nocardia yamanashiensis TaxID=209247 RepID=UPI001E3C80C2|nr:non-ribosomal peptide synthetase [Nocardia yamanashiensis]UGT40371.1 non-ribosomal peptide synthetase [Nocardia yamanashiensis]
MTKTHPARPAAGRDATAVGIAVRLHTTPTDEELTGLAATGLGLQPAEIGLWCRSVPFTADSTPAARLSRQQLRHALGNDQHARLTCTRYPDGTADVLLLATADPRPALAEFDRLGARPLPALSEIPRTELTENSGAQVDIAWGADHRGDELAAAIVATLARFLDTSTLGVDLRTAEALLTSANRPVGANGGTGYAACEIDGRGSIKDVVSRLAAAEAPADEHESSRTLRSVRITDYTGAPALYLPGADPAHDFEIVIRPAATPDDAPGPARNADDIRRDSGRVTVEPTVRTDPATARLGAGTATSPRIDTSADTVRSRENTDAIQHSLDPYVVQHSSDWGAVRLWVRGPAGESAERLRLLTRAFAHVYAQLRQAGPDLAVRDLEFAAPSDPAVPPPAGGGYAGAADGMDQPADARATARPEAVAPVDGVDTPPLRRLASTDTSTVPLEFGASAVAGRVERRVVAHAAACPDSVAVVHGGDVMSFRELDELSDTIADGLLELGVRPGDFVVAAAVKSARLFAVMVGIWKCGAAYVPVDTEFPVERVHYIIEDSKARVAVVEPGLLEALPDGTAAVSIAELVSRTPAAPELPQGLSGEAPAYAIYTSGTTGRPKGTVIAHRSALALIDALTVEYGLTPADRWSVFHSPAFDFSVWEIWGALATGGAAVVVDKDTARDPAKFHALLRDSGVTVLNQTPSAFAHLVHQDAKAPLLEALRLVILGGEALQGGSASAWLDRYPERRCRLVNMYGITETTVHVTVQPVSKQVALRAPSSVGRDIPGWRTAVFGPDLRPVAPGFPGEIFVAGAGLALYYSGNPALTATRFVAGPDGQRWYRSGDLGRVRPDGTLEHLGRIDHQIKINGYRIELDEIRNSIRRQPGVRDAIVVCNANGRFATPRLDAYVVGDLDLAELRGMVERTLPAYMRPATYTPLPAIPLTTNGKADTARLPDPLAPARPAESITEIMKTSTAQSILASAWQTVLGAEPKAEDNFFLSGGNSLAAIHLSTELSDAGLPMQLMLLYRHPVFRDLATALDN